MSSRPPLRPSRRLVPVLVAGVLLSALPAAASADDGTWSWPLGERSVARDFDLPDSPYGAGHRGIDLPGATGDTVRSVAPGRVTFSGEVAGVGVVTVSHGAERSTYQPVVERRVRKGDAVDAGQVLGLLDRPGSHCSNACLHLGRLAGDDYLDPRERLRDGHRFRLLDPDGPLPQPSAGGDGSLSRPVGGPVTSAFGMRVHPVTGVRKLHDGTDFGAACGTPVHAAAAGTVVLREAHPAYGLRVILEHDTGLRTGYTHLSGYSVSVGDRVRSGQVLGQVGTTGLSTGCHLHFMVERDGRPIDPLSVL
ncbi:peptidoglycan DD-metalloendopeptidase family protein [Aeromicrobium sp. CTD01-1L150]|uniref:peptidoglycan DD-metalloendopeptidase family protein n=1 Tax=Aeromicrobium sp. CTD01-1L150 TaxID=3341830 RepID=UPI0035BFBDF0